MTGLAGAVQRVLARHRRYLSADVCEEIADAVLAHHDQFIEAREELPLEQWGDDPGFRAYLTERMCHRLVLEALRQGYIPAALPVEDVTRGVGPWHPVIVTFRLPVRRPPAPRTETQL